MDSNIIELVKLGHERADELKAACGAVDVRTVAQLISDLASQLEVQYVRAEESQREFRSADITMQNLEAKCEKLAAENAGLKEDRDTLARYWIEDGGDEDCAMSYCEPTPATDAFLAEVRAQGVDVAIEHLINKFEGTGRIGVPVMALEWLAQELRKGARS